MAAPQAVHGALPRVHRPDKGLKNPDPIIRGPPYGGMGGDPTAEGGPEVDKSSRYIDMCKGAREIQDTWNHQTGDIFATEDGEVLFWVPGKYGAPEIKKGFGVTRTDKVVTLARYTWLPRYSQLIEAAQDNSGANFRDVTFDFYTWLDTPYAPDAAHRPKELFTTNEQVWLAYIMQKRHGKVWTGTGWEKRAKG